VCTILDITSPFLTIHLFDPNIPPDQWIDGETKGIDPGNITDGVEICSFSCSFFMYGINKAPSRHWHLLIDEGLIEQFYDQLSAVSRMKPYMVGPGNHEGMKLLHLPKFNATAYHFSTAMNQIYKSRLQ
jgi:hypothetical protein